jgi:hypothetical protein
VCQLARGLSGGSGDVGGDDIGGVPVQPPPVISHEDWPFDALANGQIDRTGGARCERDGDDLPALAGDYQGAVPALDTQGLDVRASGFGDPQPVEGQQGDEGVFRRWPESRRYQESATAPERRLGACALTTYARGRRAD